jgi:putative transposase
MDASFFKSFLMAALAKYGMPEIFDTDQRSQYNSSKFIEILITRGIKISMEGKSRALDNVFI